MATIRRAEAGTPLFLASAGALARLLGQSLDELRPAAQAEPEASAHQEHKEDPAAVAVLPFDTLGRDRDARYFADGLADDLIGRLGHHWFPVISRGSSFRYRAAGEDPRAVGRELQARYIVEGSTRRDGKRLRVTVSFVDAASGHLLWSASYDRTYRYVFELQDELTADIVGQISRSLLEAEFRRCQRQPAKDLSAWELTLRGNWHQFLRTAHDSVLARQLFEQALAKDPSCALAWYSLILTHQQEILHQWSPNAVHSLRHMGECSQTFDRYFPGDPWTHVAAAYVHVYRGERGEAMARLKEAIELDPNSCAAHSLYGQTLAMAGQPDDGIPCLETAIRLSPRDQDLWRFQTSLGLAHLAAGRYSEAVQWGERSTRTRPDIAFSHLALASAQSLLGDTDRARGTLSRARALQKEGSIADFGPLLRSTDPEIAKRFLSGLELAS